MDMGIRMKLSIKIVVSNGFVYKLSHQYSDDLHPLPNPLSVDVIYGRSLSEWHSKTKDTKVSTTNPDQRFFTYLKELIRPK